MADDLNALTPVPQPKLPNDVEYEAMCTAFAETERGRWFLAEYAKRNRNTDTTMVMKAIARIEAAMSRQVPADPGPAIALALNQTMGELRERAGQIAAEGGETLQAARRNAQKMRDVAWTLREWGTDSELCDELDALAAGIAASCEKAAEPQQKLLALLDEWNRTRTPRVADSLASPRPAAAAPQIRAETVAPRPAPEAIEPEPVAPELVTTGETEIFETVVKTETVDTEIVETRPVAETKPVPAADVSPVMATAVAASQSLGAALLAQGLVGRPRESDALAPLRRMSQSEKVAFFT